MAKLKLNAINEKLQKLNDRLSIAEDVLTTYRSPASVSAAPAVVQQLTKPIVLGRPGQRVECKVVGTDGKSHGIHALNRYNTCPKCYCEEARQKSASKRGNLSSSGSQLVLW
jgi:hypothetical protein